MIHIPFSSFIYCSLVYDNDSADTMFSILEHESFYVIFMKFFNLKYIS
jgi:hypothetical protein